MKNGDFQFTRGYLMYHVEVGSAQDVSSIWTKIWERIHGTDQAFRAAGTSDSGQIAVGAS